MQAIELIRIRLLMQSHTFDELAAWMRKHRPRVLPEAVGVLLVRLKHEGRVRMIERRWEICRPVMHMPLGPPLLVSTVGLCDECGSGRHQTIDCPEFRRAMERQEEAA